MYGDLREQGQLSASEVLTLHVEEGCKLYFFILQLLGQDNFICPQELH